MRVLLVEDDAMIGRTLVRALKDDGHPVDWVRDGLAARHALFSGEQGYAIVLLDWSLPKLSGVELLAELRKQQMGVPVLMLTARDAIEDRVQGLDAGADDYLVKPFSLDELRARMRSLLRRGSARPEATLSHSNLHLDLLQRYARYAQREIELTPREFSLLRALLEAPGSTLSRTQLEARIYGWGEEVSSNAVEFLIHSLRRKLDANLIENVRGAGWRIRTENRAQS
jgi:DNA-binding response OmpR family regulator